MRAAYWALTDVYDYPLIKSGPIYDSAVIEGNKVSISFLHTASGLMSRKIQIEGFCHRRAR